MPYFKFFRTLNEIITYSWSNIGYGKVNGVPVQSIQLEKYDLEIVDVKYWEQIYHAPGNIGIYAAHDPLVEFYIVVSYPMANYSFEGFVKFYGNCAIEDLLNFSNSLGINLTPLN